MKSTPRWLDYYIIVMATLIAGVSAWWAVENALNGSFWSMVWAFSTCAWTVIAIKQVEKRL